MTACRFWTWIVLRAGQVPESGDTMGLKVVQALVEQLDGDMTFDGKPGTSIHIRF